MVRFSAASLVDHSPSVTVSTITVADRGAKSVSVEVAVKLYFLEV